MPDEGKQQHAIMKTYGDLTHCGTTGVWALWVWTNGKSVGIRYQSIPAMYYNVMRLMKQKVGEIEAGK